MSERDDSQKHRPYVNNYQQQQQQQHQKQQASTTTTTNTTVSSNSNTVANNKTPLNSICSSKAMIVNENVQTLSTIAPTMADYSNSRGDSTSEAKKNNNKSESQHQTNDNKRKMCAVAPTTTTTTAATTTPTIQSDLLNDGRTTMSTVNNSDSLKLAGRPEKKHKGGFLSRFSGFRFSLRGKKKSKAFDNNNAVISENVSSAPQAAKGNNNSALTVKNGEKQRNSVNMNNDFIYIPLKDPVTSRETKSRSNSADDMVVLRGASSGSTPQTTVADTQPPYGNNHVLTSKPPLPRQPPRVVGVCAKPNQQQHDNGRSSATGRPVHAQRASSAPREIDVTDHLHRYRQPLDPDVATYQRQYRREMIASGCGDGGVSGHDGYRHGNVTLGGGGGTNEHKIGLIETNLDTHETVISGKTQSLMELGPQIGGVGCQRTQSSAAHRIGASVEPRRPHKSMEFLLDKENQRNILVSFVFSYNIFAFYMHLFKFSRICSASGCI